MDRNLDGIYFRVQRNGKWDNVCFSDLTEKQMDSVMKGKSEEWLKSLCKILGETIRNMGDYFDIVASMGENKE